ncbi:MAG: membrane protein insertase YidC [Muribaculaceae bacterium]|nr:membrane protein insertase YidC [Muribaculaceae bacterium]
MDKNTISGLILMAVVFFAFMWLSPKDNPSAESADTDKTEQAAVPVPTSIDSLSSNEREWLVRNVQQYGESMTLSDGRRVSVLNQGALHVTVDGNEVTGTFTVDGRIIPLEQALAGHLDGFGVKEQCAAIAALRDATTNIGRFGAFARFLNGNDSVLTLENDVLALQLNAKSGSITRAELKKYDTEYNSDETKRERRKVVIFEGNSNSFDFQLPLPQPVSSANLYFTPRVLNDSTVLMALEMSPSSYWGIEYTLPKGDSYVVRMRVVQKNMAAIAQSNNRNLGLTWTQDMHRQEKGRMFEERNSGLYYKYAGGSVENLSENKNDSEQRKAKIKWIGFKNQFFSSVLVSDRPFNTADFESQILKGSDYLKTLSTEAIVNDYDWNVESPASFSLFIGPNLYPLLSSLDKTIDAGEDLKLTRLIPLGWSIFRWINTGIVIPLFNFLGSFISNYGIIILLLTIFIKLILFPLTYKSYRSSAVMRILAPDIKAINDKYPGQENAMKRQQKTMALYSQAGANPMSGCLPMLLQMPILFAMFSFFPSAIELRGQSFLWAHDLAAPDAIISWSGNIPLVTEYFGNHISLFCLLMTITNILYTRINMQNSPGQMPGMKVMMYIMPLFFMVFFNNYAAGLSYYYFLSLLITILQTYAIRMMIKEKDVRAKMAENAKKPKKKSGFMARLEEAQRQQQEMMRQQQRKR